MALEVREGFPEEAVTEQRGSHPGGVCTAWRGRAESGFESGAVQAAAGGDHVRTGRVRRQGMWLGVTGPRPGADPGRLNEAWSAVRLAQVRPGQGGGPGTMRKGPSGMWVSRLLVC